MQQQAIHVYRWVERMNRSYQDASEHYAVGSGFLADDQIPETLLAVLRVAAEDLLPETSAAAASINAVLATNSLASGDSASRYLGQSDGKAIFTVRGQRFESVAQPYRFFQLQLVQDAYQACAENERSDIDAMLATKATKITNKARLVIIAKIKKVWRKI